MPSEPGLRERKKARTHHAISEAAIALFLQRGYDAVSVSEIAAAAEVSKRTLFSYFPSKDELVLHRFADHQDEAARVVRGRPPGVSPLDALLLPFPQALRVSATAAARLTATRRLMVRLTTAFLRWKSRR